MATTRQRRKLPSLATLAADLWDNRVTTLSGCFLGIPKIIEGAQSKDYYKVGEGLGEIVLGASARDPRVTQRGGAA